MSGREAIRLAGAGWSSPNLPVLVWRGRVAAGAADAIEATLARNGLRPGRRS